MFTLAQNRTIIFEVNERRKSEEEIGVGWFGSFVMKDSPLYEGLTKSNLLFNEYNKNK